MRDDDFDGGLPCHPILEKARADSEEIETRRELLEAVRHLARVVKDLEAAAGRR